MKREFSIILFYGNYFSFLDAIGRVGNPDFRPTEQDMLRARVSTTGIIEVKFQIKKDVELRLVEAEVTMWNEHNS